MREIKSSDVEYEELIEELEVRDEFACLVNVCGVNSSKFPIVVCTIN
ncbi:hypothetical protein ACOAKC_11825 [Hathewaya histolytica]